MIEKLKEKDGYILKKIQKHNLAFQNNSNFIFTNPFLIPNLIFWISYKNN